MFFLISKPDLILTSLFRLEEVSPRAMHGIFDRLRSLLQEGDLDLRVKYMIEVRLKTKTFWETDLVIIFNIAQFPSTHR